ncbi:MAG TPA: hypothetical protein VFP94_02185, partial [Terriglobales bacterium]|nr:hypothetical protein [Terriglobales bacterium]
MEKRRKLIAVPLLVGFIALTLAARSPRIQALHLPDYVLLIVAGVCFGLALAHGLNTARARGAG